MMISVTLGCLAIASLITIWLLIRMAEKIKEAVTNTEVLARDLARIDVSLRAEIAKKR